MDYQDIFRGASGEDAAPVTARAASPAAASPSSAAAPEPEHKSQESSASGSEAPAAASPSSAAAPEPEHKSQESSASNSASGKLSGEKETDEIELELQSMTSAEEDVPGAELTPLSETDASLGESWEQKAGWLSRLMFLYARPQLKAALKGRLETSDLSLLAVSDSSRVVTDELTAAWRAETLANPSDPRLMRVMKGLYGRRFVASLCVFIVQFICNLINPFLLVALSQELAKSDESIGDGEWLYGYALIMFGNMVVSAFAVQHSVHTSFRLAMHIKAGLTSAVYEKSFRLHPSQRGDATTGSMTNLMSNDAQRFADFMPLLLWAVAAPLVALAGFILLGLAVGWPCAVAVGLLIPLTMINGVVGKFMFAMTGLKAKRADERVKLLSECVAGIRVVKQYAWEEALIMHLTGLRISEATALRKSTVARTVAGTVVEATPMLMVAVMLVLYNEYIDELDLPTAVAVLTLMQVVRIPILLLPHAIGAFVFTAQAVKRMQEFFVLEELDQSYLSVTKEGVPRSECGVDVEAATFTWGGEEPALSDVTLSVRAGEVLAVVGSVGAGKSTLLQGMLGEMSCLGGTVAQRGRIAYCQQVAWIQNATVRNNILFGRKFDEAFYRKVVKACALQSDFEVLQDGDETEIGERGINLSGGQKQRVALARAVYAQADVYVLDDILSAVDAHVGKHIYNEVVRKLLRGRAVVLATNQLQFLPSATRIAYVADGRVAALGSYAEMTGESALDARFAGMVEEYMSSLDQQTEEEKASARDRTRTLSVESLSVSESVDAAAAAPAKKDAQVLVADEERGSGAVPFRVWMAYVRYLGGWRVGGFLLCSISYVVLRISVDAWVTSIWVPNSYDESDSYYLAVYLAGIGLAMVFHHITARMFALSGIKAASSLHNRMLDTVVHAPMTFFDSTPAGRVINRFSRDQEVVDIMLPMNVEGTANMLVFLFLVICLISFTFPVFLLAALPVMLSFKSIVGMYRAAARDCQRLESVTRSPIYSRFAETLSGIATIRSFGAQQRFIANNHRAVNANSLAFMSLKFGERWLGVHLELLSTVVIVIAATASAITRLEVLDLDSQEEREEFAGRAAIALVYASQIAFLLNWCTRQMVESETRMNAVERSLEYAALETEQSLAPVQPCGQAPTAWPTAGRIAIRDLTMRYREGLDPVVHGVSLDVEPGEKIGICGRTGSGKSSLFVSLLRLVNYEAGTITIDDVDIATLDVRKLRDAITIIPQDPVMFSGTLRFNLDPFDRFNDDEVWQALEHVQLKAAVQGMEQGLQHMVSESGDNFSVGQRQLVCLARALLRKPKVLLMDEATASVDHDTDAIIQLTVRSAFASATVLTIAHRLNTVLDSDRILVMDYGVVAEFDSPAVLRQKPGSMLSKLINET